MRKESLCATSSTRWSGKRARPRKRAGKNWRTTAKTGSPRPRSPSPPKRRPGNPFRPKVSAGFSERSRRPASARRGFSRTRLARRGPRLAFPDETYEVFLRERRAAQVALEFIAALLAQHVELLSQLHALGDHVHLQAVGHRDDRPRDGDVVAGVRQVDVLREE